MMTFREMVITENLIYTIDSDDFDKILKDNDYKRMSKGGKHEKLKLFGNGKEVLFNYDEKNKKLVVLKQGWQLMNVERGY
jgi:hypothetical protein